MKVPMSVPAPVLARQLWFSSVLNTVTFRVSREHCAVCGAGDVPDFQWTFSCRRRLCAGTSEGKGAETAFRLAGRCDPTDGAGTLEPVHVGAGEAEGILEHRRVACLERRFDDGAGGQTRTGPNTLRLLAPAVPTPSNAVRAIAAMAARPRIFRYFILFVLLFGPRPWRREWVLGAKPVPSGLPPGLIARWLLPNRVGTYQSKVL